MTSRSPPLLLVGLLLTASCGSSNDECSWTRYCESIGGDLTCVWVKQCPNDPDVAAAGRAALEAARAAPDAAWDLRIRPGDLAAVGLPPIAAALLGEEVALRTGAHGQGTWWFHDWPAADVRAALELSGQAVVDRIHACGVDAPADGACAPSLPRGARPAVPSEVAQGAPFPIEVPRMPTPPGGAIDAVAYVFTPPSSGSALIDVAPPGTPRTFTLNEVGPWRVRILIVGEGLREPDAADAVHVLDARIHVRAN